MQLALRRAYSYAFDPFRGMRGLGTCPDGSPEFSDGSCVETTTSTDPTTALQACAADPNCSLPPVTDLSLLYPAPGYNITPPVSTPALTPAQMAQEQAAASAWLLQNVPPTPAGMTTAQALSTLGLTAAQIATGLTAGTVQRAASTACPSGYKYASGPCVPGSAAGAPLIAGVSNTTLGIAAVVVLALFMMGSRR